MVKLMLRVEPSKAREILGATDVEPPARMMAADVAIFPVGSPESRAVARAVLQNRDQLELGPDGLVEIELELDNDIFTAKGASCAIAGIRRTVAPGVAQRRGGENGNDA